MTPTKQLPDANRAFGDSCGFRSIKAYAEQQWAARSTIVVDDINADPRYLCCSIKTRSELVVPIFVRDNVVGELDIDSHTHAAFSDADREFIEDAAPIVGSHIQLNQE
ncbi:MAG: GAF domain-containing protein [Bryobacteraceae bacterium]